MIEHRTLCKKCGWHTRAAFASLFHVHITCCPECGNDKPPWVNYSDNWEIIKMKSVFKAKKPVKWYIQILSQNI